MDDKDKILFVIKEENLETGLRGIPVGYCTTSMVDPQKGLFYASYPVSQIAFWKPEEVLFLLYYGKKGKEEEIHSFVSELKKREKISEETSRYIEMLPREEEPMKNLSMAILLLGIFEGAKDYREDCLRLIAKIPHLVASVINAHAGWGKTPSPDPKLGYMENFVRMLNIPNKDEKKLEEVLRLFNILHYDHGGGNLSTFVGKAVASGLEDLYGSIVAAMCALSGPRHGRANEESLAFVKEVLEACGGDADEKSIEEFLRNKLKNRELIFGFGHAVLRVEDPRATIFYEHAKRHYSSNPLIKIASLLRKVGPKILQENPKISNPYPNIDAISGSVLSASGFAYPNYYILLFGLARCVGISIQIVYERCIAREGKGTPIVRPKYIYKSVE